MRESGFGWLRKRRQGYRERERPSVKKTKTEHVLWARGRVIYSHDRKPTAPTTKLNWA